MGCLLQEGLLGCAGPSPASAAHNLCPSVPSSAKSRGTAALVWHVYTLSACSLLCDTLLHSRWAPQGVSSCTGTPVHHRSLGQSLRTEKLEPRGPLQLRTRRRRKHVSCAGSEAQNFTCSVPSGLEQSYGAVRLTCPRSTGGCLTSDRTLQRLCSGARPGRCPEVPCGAWGWAVLR